jgi:hypothetical protein
MPAGPRKTINQGEANLHGLAGLLEKRSAKIRYRFRALLGHLVSQPYAGDDIG